MSQAWFRAEMGSPMVPHDIIYSLSLQVFATVVSVMLCCVVA